MSEKLGFDLSSLELLKNNLKELRSFFILNEISSGLYKQINMH